jgi:hypothetical protein
MNFQRQERHLRWAEEANARTVRRDPSCSVPLESEPKPIPPRRARTVAPEPLPPFSALVEIPCQDCGAKGYDSGSVNPHQPEVCPACQGSGKETVLRNYLAEAFRIAADPKTNLQLERAHLVALTAYARQTVSALIGLAEVA